MLHSFYVKKTKTKTEKTWVYDKNMNTGQHAILKDDSDMIVTWAVIMLGSIYGLFVLGFLFFFFC